MQSDRWNNAYRAFVRELNLFMLEYNEGRFDSRRWKKVREAWAELETA